ncbi:MAG: aspartate aminotransferase family protein [Burkholderiaceae bacterium]
MSPLMQTYARLDVGFARGKGSWLFDDQGEAYLDGLSGIAVNTLGHSHPRFVKDIADQAATLIHTSNLYQIPLQTQLAERLVSLSGMTNAFFCNSGLEANEAALKLARLHGHNKGFSHPEVIVFKNSFHGRSIATLSATANPKVQKGFGPLVEGFTHLPLNDLGAIEQTLREKQQVSAIFLESIQGEGGIRPADVAFLKSLRAIADQHDVLLMLDEVQCGIGRTGRWFAHQWANVTPDVMPLAKGLGSGVPIGAVVAHGKAASLFTPGSHGTTFGGNPLAMRAGLSTLAIIEDESLLENATARGQQIRAALEQAFKGEAAITEIRGQGLMIGIELDRPCAEIVKLALAAKLLVNVTADRVVRLLPPLTINADEASELVNRLIPVIKGFLDNPAS